jgi:hypothetical protein
LFNVGSNTDIQVEKSVLLLNLLLVRPGYFLSLGKELLKFKVEISDLAWKILNRSSECYSSVTVVLI